MVVLKSIPSKEGVPTAASSVGVPPEPLEPKLSSLGMAHRGPPAKLPSIESTSRALTPLPSAAASSSSLYPTLTLTEGDEQYKLPPLNSTSTAPITSSPDPILPSLKSLAAAGSVTMNPERAPRRTLTGESDELAREVGKIELASAASSPALSNTSISSPPYEHPSPSLPKKSFYDVVEKRNIPLDERRRHAELIKSLLVGINEDFKRRSGFVPQAKHEADDKMDVDEVTAEKPLHSYSSNKDVEMCSA
ncbi:hypothetical protein BT96DRAFT_992869 [Gymnopus androsaceus JB14]|uniref:Uncharacterized protein n=1 Tax=Gymnopus androsaceus JB14 TaxID=1447944 RepID=A0A6A4HUG0_9AGAR|nr:hypothetical protein BT96DRAFT_992869 [Gymnopus androsaceus JB14]